MRVFRTKKFCPECQLNLPLRAFQNNASRGDGKQVYCSSCQALRNHYNREAYPERERARWAVRQAIDRGEIKRAAHCFTCMGTSNIVGHSDDLMDPVSSVVWLCQSCAQKEAHDDHGATFDVVA
jgi:hypothetical protein